MRVEKLYNQLKEECQLLANIYVHEETLPNNLKSVELIGTGYWGKCYRLVNYPGLVIKLCAKERDAFPVYIRYLQMQDKKYKWMPRIIATGGCEVYNCFWCVMPEYQSIRESNYYQEGVAEVPILGQFKGAYEQFKQDIMWIKEQEIDIDYLVSRETSANHLISLRRVLWHLAKQINSFDNNGGLAIDIHSGNLVWDSTRECMILLDPFKSVDVDLKLLFKNYDED